MPFDPTRCVLAGPWCGDGDRPVGDRKYSHTGTRSECLRRGFGAGTAIEKKKHLPADSLQRIPYIGATYERRLKRAGVDTLADLIEYARRGKHDIKILLQAACTKKNKSLDKKAYNSALLYIFKEGGVRHLPKCKSSS
jgi:hypothetical protein